MAKLLHAINFQGINCKDANFIPIGIRAKVVVLIKYQIISIFYEGVF